MGNNVTIKFLVGKHFRILRHFILGIAVFVLTLSFIWYTPLENVPGYYKVYAWIIYIFFFGGIIYLNVYIFVPQLLLRNKLSKYIIVLYVSTLFFILCIAITQLTILKIDPRHTFNIYTFLANILSAVLILTFLYLGTTSMALVKYWIMADLEKAELESSVLESELKLLKNQVNPHFLFNMLNNANMLLKKDKEQASQVLFKLEDLLRYQINDSVKEKVLLGHEVHFLNDYLNLEKIRRDFFEYTIQVSGNIEKIEVPPLLFIIFVENAIKHNPDNEYNSYVNIEFRVNGNRLDFFCENSKPEFQVVHPNSQGGLGLKNIRRRLDILFPDNYNLEIVEQQHKYTINLRLTL